MKLRDYQKDFFTYWSKFCDVGIMLWDRQSGKTQSSIQELCRLASDNSGYEISVFFHGSALVFARDEFLRKFDDIGKSHLIKQQNAKIIRLTNNSVIRLHNLRGEQSLRGILAHTIYVDEFDFMTNRSFEEIILYKVAVPNVKIILSTSNIDSKKLSALQFGIGFNNYFIHNNQN